jgi:hypothetical protein
LFAAFPLFELFLFDAIRREIEMVRAKEIEMTKEDKCLLILFGDDEGDGDV